MGILITYIQLPIPPWIKGMVIAVLSCLPIVILVAEKERERDPHFSHVACTRSRGWLGDHEVRTMRPEQNKASQSTSGGAPNSSLNPHLIFAPPVAGLGR